MFVAASLLSLVLAADPAVMAPPPAAWADSSDGVHLFLTFDSHCSNESIASNPHAAKLDYVRGASAHHIPAYRSSTNPDTVLSSCIPCCRDGEAKYLDGMAEYKRKGWGDRILYQCDRATPAWTHYPGESFNETALIPVDFSNPVVVDWQIETYVQKAAAEGFDAIDWDNFGLSNEFRACGIWSKAGKWVQLYNNETEDPAYAEAAVTWLVAVKRKVNAITTKVSVLRQRTPAPSRTTRHQARMHRSPAES